ncbi:hypothetical protein BJY52DRAFT_1190234 [Lactarius psammicola]|nr:hypothetical protein BJY52DRAFT_1190234 [Lactarius psammicola]
MGSWEVPFIGIHALEALKLHIVEQKTKELSYDPYCSDVQSSGMEKSRLLDEFSKTNFLIPINLREKGAEDFPPPDDAIRDLLTKGEGNGGNSIYSRMLHFLIELFERTRVVITNDLKGIRSRPERIAKFREFMTDGQTMASVGENRRKFHNEITIIVGSRMNSVAKADDTRAALKNLIKCPSTSSRTGKIDKFPDVFIIFDEAHPLTELLIGLISPNFARLFQNLAFAVPKDIDQPHRMGHGPFEPSLPFSDLAFDQLMRGHKIFDNIQNY